MKVYIITYSWFNEMAGHEDGVYDVFLDLDQATKKFNEMVKEDAKSFQAIWLRLNLTLSVRIME